MCWANAVTRPDSRPQGPGAVDALNSLRAQLSSTLSTRGSAATQFRTPRQRAHCSVPLRAASSLMCSVFPGQHSAQDELDLSGSSGRQQWAEGCSGRSRGGQAAASQLESELKLVDVDSQLDQSAKENPGQSDSPTLHDALGPRLRSSRANDMSSPSPPAGSSRSNNPRSPSPPVSSKGERSRRCRRPSDKHGQVLPSVSPPVDSNQPGTQPNSIGIPAVPTSIGIRRDLLKKSSSRKPTIKSCSPDSSPDCTRTSNIGARLRLTQVPPTFQEAIDMHMQHSISTPPKSTAKQFESHASSSTSAPTKCLIEAFSPKTGPTSRASEVPSPMTDLTSKANEAISPRTVLTSKASEALSPKTWQTSEANEELSPRTGPTTKTSEALSPRTGPTTKTSEALAGQESAAASTKPTLASTIASAMAGLQQSSMPSQAVPTIPPPGVPRAHPPSALLARRNAQQSESLKLADGLKLSIRTQSHHTVPHTNLSGVQSAWRAQFRSQTADAPSERKIRCLKPHEKIFDLYFWDQVLQEDGDGGKVVVCRAKGPAEKENGKEFVMKIRTKESLKKTGMDDHYRKSQERVLNFPRHQGVIRLHEVLENDEFFYVIMDKASGGPFLDSLIDEFRDGVVPLPALKKLMKQIFEAVSHIHGQGMLHRDIKPDNLVMHYIEDPLSPTGLASKVMLIDFDHADPEFTPLSPTTKATNAIYGTLRFNAPETFHGQFSQESDLYSVGVVLYLLMTGKMPYLDEIFDQSITTPKSRGRVNWRAWYDAIYESLKEACIDWQCSPWPSSPICRDFCQNLLAFDPRHRFPSAEKALDHQWFKVES